MCERFGLKQQQDTIELDLPATYKYLNVLGACIAEMLARVEGLDEAEVVIYNIQLAVHETCANIIEYAYGNRAENRIKISLSLSDAPLGFQVMLHDAGRAFDPAQVAAPDLEQMQERGYGLFLIRNLMDEVSYEAKNGTNCWILTKRLHVTLAS